MIGLITVYEINNFGSSLQAFALKSFIEEQGYEVFVINIQNNTKHFEINKLLKYIRFFFKILRYPIILKIYLDSQKRRRTYDLSDKAKMLFKQFTKEFLNEKIFTYHNLKKTSKQNKIKAFICGSDQIWSVTYYNLGPDNFLRFAPKFKRIAYAPSFGVSDIPEYHKAILKKYLKGLDYISVREQQGAKIIEELIDKKVQVVLDPSLLVTKEFWDKRAVSPYQEKPYILFYFLNEPSQMALEYSDKIINLLKYNIIIIPYCYECFKKYENVQQTDKTPYEFLGLIKNAAFVLTDSFHGVTFSINFNVPFFVFDRQYRLGFNESSRVSSILNILGLENRWIKTGIEISENTLKIDFNECNLKLESERFKSREFLISSLKSIEEKKK
jgi:hypothetical protein